MAKITSGQRPRTCRACGKKFEYPLKGSASTRHHCEDCVHIPPSIRTTLERLNTRLAKAEYQLSKLQQSPAS